MERKQFIHHEVVPPKGYVPPDDPLHPDREELRKLGEELEEYKRKSKVPWYAWRYE